MTTPRESTGGAEAPTAPETRPARLTKVLRQLHEFRPDQEPFTVYLERVEIFFVVNDIPAEKKVSVFINSIGGTAYGVLRNLIAPASPMDKSFEFIVGKLTDHYDPKPLIIVERYHFHKRDQATGETVGEYVAELRRLATKCNFGAYFKEALRDRLVCGIKSEQIQKGLLAEADLDLAKAVKRATAMEAARSHTQAMKGQQPVIGKTEASPRPQGGGGSAIAVEARGTTETTVILKTVSVTDVGNKATSAACAAPLSLRERGEVRGGGPRRSQLLIRWKPGRRPTTA